MTITKEGTLASFYTINKAPIKHLRVYFSPKQAGSGTASPSNIRNISGWENLKFFHCGKNICSIAVGGEYMPVILPANTLVTASSAIGGNITFLNTENNNWTRYSQSINDINRYNVTFNIPEDMDNYKFNRMYGGQKCQLELGDKATEYEPYHANIQNIDWSNDIGMIHGGYIDLITGELVQTHEVITLNSSNLTVSTITNSKNVALFTIGDHADCIPISNYMKGVYNTGVQSLNEWELNFANKKYIQARLGDDPSLYGTPTLVVNYLDKHPLYVCLALETPITYQLTPLELQTFVGRNNIWSNANRVEVEYDLAESNEELYKRRNILLQGAPHLETATDNIASFNTDLIAPLKSAQVNFLPTLLCDGVQSPTNVGTFVGNTNITLFSSSSYISLDPINFESVANGPVTPYYLGGNKFYFEGTADTTRIFNFSITPFTLYKNQSRYVTIVTDTESKTFSSKKVGLVLRNSGKTLTTTVITLNELSHQTNTTTLEWPDDNAVVDQLAIALYPGLKNVTVQFVFSYNPINDTSISLGSTLYGGYVDLITGDLIQTHATFTFNNTSSPTLRVIANTNNNYAPYIGATQSSFPQEEWLPSLDNNKLLCNIFKPVGTMLTDTHLIQPYETGFYIAANGLIRVVFGLPQEISDTTKLGNLFTETGGAQFVYKLATPIHYQKTSSQLKSLKGTNSIWSNTNSSVSIKYWTH